MAIEITRRGAIGFLFGASATIFGAETLLETVSSATGVYAQQETKANKEVFPLYSSISWREWAAVPAPDAQSSANEEQTRGFSVDSTGKMRLAHVTLLGQSANQTVMVEVGEYQVGVDGNLPNESNNSQLKIIDLLPINDYGRTVSEVMMTRTYGLPLALCNTDVETGKKITEIQLPECNGVNSGVALLLKMSDGSRKLVMMENGQIKGYLEVASGDDVISVTGLNNRDGSAVVQFRVKGVDKIYVFSSAFGKDTAAFRRFKPKNEINGPVQVEVMNHDSNGVITIIDRAKGRVSYYKSSDGTSNPDSLIAERTVEPTDLATLQYESQGNLQTVLQIDPGETQWWSISLASVDKRGSVQRTSAPQDISVPKHLSAMQNVKLLGSVRNEGYKFITFVSATLGESAQPKLIACRFDIEAAGEFGQMHVLGDYHGESLDQLNTTIIVPSPQVYPTLANRDGVSAPYYSDYESRQLNAYKK